MIYSDSFVFPSGNFFLVLVVSLFMKDMWGMIKNTVNISIHKRIYSSIRHVCHYSSSKYSLTSNIMILSLLPRCKAVWKYFFCACLQLHCYSHLNILIGFMFIFHGYFDFEELESPGTRCFESRGWGHTLMSSHLTFPLDVNWQKYSLNFLSHLLKIQKILEMLWKMARIIG